MFANIFKITLRTLGKQKVYAAINIVGLAVGIAFCTLIYLYVRDELTYDRFHEKADRIYRVLVAGHNPDGSVSTVHPWQPMPLAPALEADLPEVEAAVRFYRQAFFVRRGDVTTEEQLLFADPAVLEVFTFPLLRGDPATALDDLNAVVLSERAARTYFGDADPLGQTLSIRLEDTFEDFTVTGVAQDVPPNSSIRFDVLAPFATLPATIDWIRSRTDRWNASSFFTYVLLREGATDAAAEAKLPAFRATYYPNEADEARAEGKWTGEGSPSAYRLQPLTAIHLDPTVLPGLALPSDPTYSYLLAAIALGILLIACINFTTLAIGRSTGRAREIGVRKVVGAHRYQLKLQFWGEAVLLSLLALGLGVGLAELFLPTFNTLAGKDLALDLFSNALTGAVLVGLMLLIGLVAGGYPAVVLSGFKPIDTLRQRVRLGGANVLTRGLVVVQFALSVFLIAGTAVMLRQFDYLQTKNLGFDREQVVVLPTQGLDGADVLGRFRPALEGRADVLGLTGVSTAFTHGYSLEGFRYHDVDKRAYTYRVEANYVDVMGMTLIAGRSFDPNLGTDSTRAVLVNEALVRDFGWTEPLGQVLHGFYDDPTVVGVVKDVNFLSLHQAVEPMVLTLDPSWHLGYLLVRIAPADVPATLDALRAAWTQVAPDVPFQYSFLDDDMNAQYRNEERWSRIVGYAAGFAILIACLGLFGLASLSVTGRTKEVGIRKVLGASAASVAVLLSTDLARLVLVAILLATPVAYLAMHRWLDGFAYRIELSWTIFLWAGLIALGVAILTVSYQAVRAALADPVDSLRYE